MSNKYDAYNAKVKDIVSSLNGITSEKDMECAIAKNSKLLNELKKDFIQSFKEGEYFGFIKNTKIKNTVCNIRYVAQITEITNLPDETIAHVEVVTRKHDYKYFSHFKISDEFISDIVRFFEPELKVKKEIQSLSENACPKCNGTGYISAFKHIDNGVCFKCGGTGKKKED